MREFFRKFLGGRDYSQAMKNLLYAEQLALKLNRELMSERLQKNGAYNERNMCISLIAKMAQAMGYVAGLGKHEGPDSDPEFQDIVFIDLPSGQVSWHVHKDEMYLFDFLPTYAGKWDGHSTSVKYNRVLNPGV